MQVKQNTIGKIVPLAHFLSRAHRQFMSEFGSPEMPIYFLNVKGEHKEHKFGDLLPLSFGLEQGEQYLMDK